MEKIGLVVLNQATHYDHLESFTKTWMHGRLDVPGQAALLGSCLLRQWLEIQVSSLLRSTLSSRSDPLHAVRWQRERWKSTYLEFYQLSQRWHTTLLLKIFWWRLVTWFLPHALGSETCRIRSRDLRDLAGPLLASSYSSSWKEHEFLASYPCQNSTLG